MKLFGLHIFSAKEFDAYCIDYQKAVDSYIKADKKFEKLATFIESKGYQVTKDGIIIKLPQARDSKGRFTKKI